MSTLRVTIFPIDKGRRRESIHTAAGFGSENLRSRSFRKWTRPANSGRFFCPSWLFNVPPQRRSPLIAGTVTDERVPVIDIDVAGRKWRAVIDTGFNGDVELPAELKEHLQCRYFGRFKSHLAAGKVVGEDVYRLEFPFDGERVSVTATFASGNEILIGTRLMKNYRLEIDFPARTVMLKRVYGAREKCSLTWRRSGDDQCRASVPELAGCWREIRRWELGRRQSLVHPGRGRIVPPHHAGSS
jgi:predicted aspartyl protease